MGIQKTVEKLGGNIICEELKVVIFSPREGRPKSLRFGEYRSRKKNNNSSECLFGSLSSSRLPPTTAGAPRPAAAQAEVLPGRTTAS